MPCRSTTTSNIGGVTKPALLEKEGRECVLMCSTTGYKKFFRYSAKASHRNHKP